MQCFPRQEGKKQGSWDDGLTLDQGSERVKDSAFFLYQGTDIIYEDFDDQSPYVEPKTMWMPEVFDDLPAICKAGKHKGDTKTVSVVDNSFVMNKMFFSFSVSVQNSISSSIKEATPAKGKSSILFQASSELQYWQT